MAALLGAALPAQAALPDFAVAPWSLPLGNAELRLNGEAGGALFAPHQPGRRGAQASGALLLMPQLRRDYDSGLSLALNGTFAAADPLSRGRYDGDVIERLSASARTGLGTLEIGIADGAGDALAVSGPKVDPKVSLDDPRTSFYRDPVTGRAVTNLFALRTQVSASSNYAKFVYTSPSLFGAQLALSFTPTEGKQLPFLDAGPDVPGRQATFWEAALRYETELAGAGIAASAAVSESRGEHKLPGQQGTSHFGFGLRVDYPLTEELTASVSGTSTVPRIWNRLNLPTVTSPLKRNSLPGSCVTIEIAPPMVLRPNGVPCGPLSTSIRSTSGRSWLAPTERAR